MRHASVRFVERKNLSVEARLLIFGRLLRGSSPDKRVHVLRPNVNGLRQYAHRFAAAIDEPRGPKRVDDSIEMGTNHDSCGLRRRTGLNTTAKFTIASVALFLSPAAAQAASQSVALQVVWSAASTGQNGANANRDAEELLSKARQAMNEDNFELADSYIARAERTGPKYSVFHLGDTPKKAREDLQKKLAARKGGKSKSRFFGGKEPAQDPFAARRAADAEQEPQLSTAGSAFPADRGPVVGDMVRRGGQGPAPGR